DFLSYMRDFLRAKKSDRSYAEVFAKACENEISKVQS
ncbi:polysaccharide biosynthesis protein, partial [Campylobacter jejuni]|nr:polysaccharide biosynthesis protein [Campylobacter jejuni]